MRKEIRGTKGRLTEDHLAEVESILGESLEDIIARNKADHETAMEDLPEDEQQSKSFSPKKEALKALREKLVELDPSQKARERIGRVLNNLKDAGFDTEQVNMVPALIEAKNLASSVIGDDFKRMLNLQRSETIAWAKGNSEAAKAYYYQIKDLIDALPEDQQDMARIGLLAQQFFDATASKNAKIYKAAMEKAGKAWTMEQVGKEDPDYMEWKIESRSRFHRVVGIFEKTAAELEQRITDELQLGEDSMLAGQGKAVKIMSQPASMWLPANVVKELNRLEENNKPNPGVLRLLKNKFDKGFRITALFWPTRILKREFGNWLTDLPLMMTGIGRGIWSDYSDAAEMLQHFDSNKLNFEAAGKMADWLRDAYRDDVIGVGQAAIELRGSWSLRDMDQFKQFIVAEADTLKKAAELLPKMGKAYLEFVRSSEKLLELTRSLPDKPGITQAKAFVEAVAKAMPYGDRREDTVRLAAYLHFRKMLERTGGNLDYYYFSNPGLIKGLYQDLGASAAAARMARDFFGNYRDTSVAAQFLRKNMMPFWNWTETVNSRTWWMAYNSIHHQGGWGRKATSALSNLTPLISMYLWNNMFNEEDEKNITSYDKVRAHVIIPRIVREGAAAALNPLGANIDPENPWLIRNSGLLGDFVGQFGGIELLSRFYEKATTSNGLPLAEILKIPAKAFVDRILGSLGPEYDMAIGLGYAIASGSDLGITMPSSDQPARLKKIDELLAAAYGVGNDYDVAKAMLRPGHAYKGAKEYLGNALVTIADKMDANLNEVHTYVNRYNKEHKKDQSSILPASELKDLRFWARRDNQAEFEKARTRWLEEHPSNNYLSFRANIAALDPISRVGAKNMGEFMSTLSEEEKGRLEVAREYQKQLQIDMWQMWRRAAAKDSPEIRERLQDSEDTEIITHVSDAARPTSGYVAKATDYRKAADQKIPIWKYMQNQRDARIATKNAGEEWIRDRPMLTGPAILEAVQRQRKKGKISDGEAARMIWYANRMQ